MTSQFPLSRPGVFPVGRALGGACRAPFLPLPIRVEPWVRNIPRRGERRDSTEVGSCQEVGRKRVGCDCLMGRVVSLGDESGWESSRDGKCLTSQTHSVPQSGSLESAGFAYEFPSQLREGKTASSQRVSLSPSLSSPRAPRIPLSAPSPLFPWGRLGRASKCSSFTP